MTIAFSGTIGHAPGWVAWPERAKDEQRATLADGVEHLAQAVRNADLDVLIMFTSEHWTNFFLDHISPFCVGVGDGFAGPVEPWMRMDKTIIPGAPKMANDLVKALYAGGVETGFSHELVLDHGTMVPLKFLTPELKTPIIPIFFNTLAAPQPSPARCLQLGQIVGELARDSDQRVGLLATGGMSHDPGETAHGEIDSDFDKKFLDQMTNGNLDALAQYSIAELNAAGAGTIELIAWIALAGALGKFEGKTLAYEPVVEWATGMGIMQLEAA